MGKRIVIIQGHPDPSENHLGYALAVAYTQGAEQAGHEVKQIKVSSLAFPLLRTKADFESGEPPSAIREAQVAIAWADHLVILYPLWLGTMPALLKGFFEQVFRPGFAATSTGAAKMWKKLLTGKSARIVVTMGMPAIIYRWYFGAHGLKSLKRNVLAFAGISPVKETLIGMVDTEDHAKHASWLAKMHAYGKAGA